MDQKLKYRIANYKMFIQEPNAKKLLNIGFGKDFLKVAPKARATERKHK